MASVPDTVEVITPAAIAAQLAEVSRLIFAADELTLEDKQGLADRLRAAANNVRIMNSLEFTNGQMLPRNAGEMWYMVDLIVKAQAAPSSYNNNPATIFLGVQKAIELGVDPITGLSNIMVVNNRLSVWGDLAQALIQRSGQLERQTAEKIGEWPDESQGLAELATWPLSAGWRVTTWRKGHADPYVGEFTVANAKRGGMWMNSKKQPWITDPERMLFNRARARSQRDGFSDGLHGMAIAEEQADIQGGVARNAQPLLAAPVSIEDDDEPVTMLSHASPAMQDFANMATPELAPVSDTPIDQAD